MKLKLSRWKPVLLNLYLRESVVAAVACIFCAQAGAATLHDAIHQTLVNHPEILSAKAEENAAAHDVREARGGYLPTLDLFAGFGKENTDNPATRGTGRGDRTLTRQESEFQFEQLIWDGGFVKNRVGERRYLHERSGFQVAEDQERLAFEAAQAYLSIKRDQELVEVSKLDVRAHKESLSKVTRRLEAGAGRKSEINLVDSRLALATTRLVTARGNLSDSKVNYEKLVGVKPSERLPMPAVPTNMPRSMSEAQEMGLQTSPAIAAFGAELEATQSAIGVARSTFYPRFTLDLEGSWSDDLDGIKGHNNDLLAVVRMHYNVLRGGSDKAAFRAAIDRKAAASFALENTKRNVREDIGLDWIEWITTKKRITELRTHRDESLAVYKAYQKQFQLGQRTLFDLLNAQVEYYGARRDLIADVYEEKISRYRLLSAMGRLVHTVSHHNARHPLMNLTKADNANTQLAKAKKAVVNTKVAGSHANPSSVIKAKAPMIANKKMAHPESKRYTLQLMASTDRHAVDDFVAKHHLQGKATVYPAKVKGHHWFRLTYGNYSSLDGAKAAKQKLPMDLAKIHPMVRNLALVGSDDTHSNA